MFSVFFESGVTESSSFLPFLCRKTCQRKALSICGKLLRARISSIGPSANVDRFGSLSGCHGVEDAAPFGATHVLLPSPKHQQPVHIGTQFRVLLPALLPETHSASVFEETKSPVGGMDSFARSAPCTVCVLHSGSTILGLLCSLHILLLCTAEGCHSSSQVITTCTSALKCLSLKTCGILITAATNTAHLQCCSAPCHQV